MFKNILKKTYLMFNKVKVVHSIPGRIRLLIPSLDKYDKTKLKEQDIVDWLNKIWKIIIDNEEVYQGMSVDEVDKNVKKFYEMLKSELEGRINQ